MPALHALLPTAPTHTRREESNLLPFSLASTSIYPCSSAPHLSSSGDSVYDDLLRELWDPDEPFSDITEQSSLQPFEQPSIITTINPIHPSNIQRMNPSQDAIVPKLDEAASFTMVTNHLLTPAEPSQFSPISSDESSPVSVAESAAIEQMETTSTCNMNLDEKVDRLKQILDRYEKIVQANGSNGKFQVHQVVHLLLLATVNSQVGIDLDNVLVFCDNGGKPSAKSRHHFRAQDTRTMGLIWQKIKGNKNCNYDTFARAMRVGRERSKEYFEYLESGKGSKKRVYKLGAKSTSEMRRMEELLPKICA